MNILTHIDDTFYKSTGNYAKVRFGKYSVDRVRFDQSDSHLTELILDYYELMEEDIEMGIDIYSEDGTHFARAALNQTQNTSKNEFEPTRKFHRQESDPCCDRTKFTKARAIGAA